MTIDELQARLPEQFRPWAATYGPAFLAMTAQEVKAWIEMLIRGDVLPAYQAVLAKLPNADLLNEWDKLNQHVRRRYSPAEQAAARAIRTISGKTAAGSPGPRKESHMDPLSRSQQPQPSEAEIERALMEEVLSAPDPFEPF